MKRWYVVHSRANAERRALQNLEKQGYVTWLPLCRKTRRHARRIETVLRPLFPRYLFVQLDIEAEPWRAVLSTFGVHSVVSDGDTPLPMDEAVVEGLLARAGDVPYIRQLADSVGAKETPYTLPTDACVLCARCVRACREIVGVGAISMAHRGSERMVAAPFRISSADCIECATCVFVCPTGAITLDDITDRGDCLERADEVLRLGIACRYERHEPRAARVVRGADRRRYTFMRFHGCAPSPGISSTSACPCHRGPSYR